MNPVLALRRALVLTSADMFAQVADAGLRLQLQRSALDVLVKGARTSIVVNLLLLVLVLALLLPQFSSPAFVVLSILLVLANAERFMYVGRMARARSVSDDDPLAWARGMVWRIALTASLVGCWTYFILRVGGESIAIYLLPLITVHAAGYTLSACCWPPAMWAYLLIMPPAIALQVLWFGASSLVVGVVSFLLLGFVLGAAGLRFARALHSDMTNRLINEALTRELDDKRQQAEAANAAKSRFMAAASHDLRQPVHGMTLLADALIERLADQPAEPLARQLGEGVTSFADLIDEVMDLAQIDSHEVRLQATPLPALLARARASFGPNADARGLALWLRLPANETPVVLADPALLWRVLSNLLSNALRYTPLRPGAAHGDGGVMVAVRRARSPLGDPAWRIEVRDNGPGLTAEQRELVFEEFYQAHNPHRTRSHGDGYGLGLAVARRLARQMDSDVLLHPSRTASGSGAIFSITLPTAPQAAAKPVEPEFIRRNRSSLRGLRVMAVDDDPRAGHAVLALLQGWGAQVWVATGVQSAESLVGEAARQGTPPHALLTDHWLAGGEQSGDVIDAVRRHAPAVRIAVVSGGARPEDVPALGESGTVFLRKPLRPQALHDWLSEARAAAELKP